MMKYSIKWVEENLGITRKTINDYMSNRYGYIEDKRKSGNPIEFTEEEIKIIWYIKTFIGMGYTHKDIKNMINNKDYDFSESISDRIEQLNDEIKLKIQALQVAKTIKLTGRVPIIKEIGTMKYDEFMNFIKNNWNFASDPEIASFYEIFELSLKKDSNDYTEDDINKICNTLENLGLEKLYFFATIETFYKILIELKKEDYKCKAVQTIVKALYQYFYDNSKKLGINVEFNKHLFASLFNQNEIGGDILKMYEIEFGKDEIDFIFQATTYFEERDGVEDNL